MLFTGASTNPGMASSSNVFKYPPRLYAEGKSPLQHRSMNHNCYLSKIGQIREGLGIDVWDELEIQNPNPYIPECFIRKPEILLEI
ncbi:unnamed protein product [Arabidopsis halleri]